MPKVEFITTGHSHLVGNFSAGDTFTGGEAECKHFVDEAMCAKWVSVQTPGQAEDAAKVPAVPVKTVAAKRSR
ncbi:hypothetical protein DBR42_04350 [Pelomonas sp. HMWF004]|nr:hypothetical protein DBR42_04350 [Pelomonas sp. HMWF004]